jgi:DNA-binding response OmpR family regulator
VVAAALPRAGTVLVIEDNAELRELYRAALTSSHYKVTGAADGFKALVILDQDRPDVVVLDLDLPGVSGWDVYRDLRSHPSTATLPIIIATGQPLGDIDVKDLAAVLHKPVDPFLLMTAVDDAIRWR